MVYTTLSYWYNKTPCQIVPLLYFNHVNGQGLLFLNLTKKDRDQSNNIELSTLSYEVTPMALTSLELFQNYLFYGAFYAYDHLLT
jgi:hypothetical protein